MQHIHHLSQICEYIRSFGYLAPFITIMLFIIQSAFPIFPYAVLVAASVLLFGWATGFVLSILGALTGSVLCFWACRKLGAEWFNDKILHRWGYDSSRINSGIAFGGIALAHLVPILPGAVITAAAAFSGVNFWSFAAATTLGFIPATLAYSGLGFLFRMHELRKALVVLGLILLILYLSKNAVKRKFSKELP